MEAAGHRVRRPKPWTNPFGDKYRDCKAQKSRAGNCNNRQCEATSPENRNATQMMVNHDGREWKQIAGIASDRDQLYLAHAQCSMKERVTGGRKRPVKSSSTQHPNGRIVHEEKKREQSGRYAAGGETGSKNMKELCCKRKTAVRHED